MVDSLNVSVPEPIIMGMQALRSALVAADPEPILDMTVESERMPDVTAGQCSPSQETVLASQSTAAALEEIQARSAHRGDSRQRPD